MARYYRVTMRHTQKEANELAKSLGKDLKSFGFSGEMRVVPIEERVEGGKTHMFYAIESIATPGELHDVMRLMNSEPPRQIQKVHREKDLTPEFKKHLKKPTRSAIIEDKKDLTWRKEFIKKGGKIPSGTIGKSHTQR